MPTKHCYVGVKTLFLTIRKNNRLLHRCIEWVTKTLDAPRIDIVGLGMIFEFCVFVK